MRRQYRSLLLIVITLFTWQLRAVAQEHDVDNSLDKPDDELTQKEKERRQEERDFVLHGIPTRVDNAAESLKFPIKIGDLENRRPFRLKSIVVVTSSICSCEERRGRTYRGRRSFRRSRFRRSSICC